jgi:dolichol kinase
MSIRSKAMIETGKFLAYFSIIFCACYVLLDQLGPKFGTIVIALGLIGSFAWTIYDYFYNKFTWQEKYKD